MNRVSRRSAAEAADALLEVGRTQPVLDYDVELGLARHHQWLRNEAPLPEWAGNGVTTAARSFMAVVIKTFVSTLLIGVIATVAWQARSLLQPSAATLTPLSPGVEPVQVQAAATNVEDVTAADPPKPIPVPDHALPSDRLLHRAVHDKRTARLPLPRPYKEPASTPRAETVASARAEPLAATTAPQDPQAPAASTAAQPSESASVSRAARDEVAASSEPKPTSAAQRAQAEPGSQAHGPDDLVEMQQVATAEQLLERSPGRALTLVRQGDQRFARGYFQQERAYIAIMALIRLGRLEEARTRAASFSKQFPALPYGARIRSALEARAAAH